MYIAVSAAILACIASTLAQPTQTHSLTVSGLLDIAPQSASCAGVDFPAECRTAAQSLPHIQASFAKYNITTAAVQAALVSLMAYESGEFRYNRNHFPGVPGQGTRNMQSADFNREYAAALGLGTPAQRADPDRLMALVGRDEFSFASAAWFVVAQCPLSTRRGMWGGGQAGWEGYLADCVGADASQEGRREYWIKATKALGL